LSLVHAIYLSHVFAVIIFKMSICYSIKSFCTFVFEMKSFFGWVYINGKDLF